MLRSRHRLVCMCMLVYLIEPDLFLLLDANVTDGVLHQQICGTPCSICFLGCMIRCINARISLISSLGRTVGPTQNILRRCPSIRVLLEVDDGYHMMVVGA